MSQYFKIQHFSSSPNLSRLQTICKTSVRCEKHVDTTPVYGLFRIFYADSLNRFLMSHVLNRLAVEAVIMHETKWFSRAIRDKIIAWKNNQIAKRVWLIFKLSRACPFFLISFSHLACFSHLTDISWIVCSWLYNLCLPAPKHKFTTLQIRKINLIFYQFEGSNLVVFLITLLWHGHKLIFCTSDRWDNLLCLAFTCWVEGEEEWDQQVKKKHYIYLYGGIPNTCMLCFGPKLWESLYLAETYILIYLKNFRIRGGQN